MWKNLSAGTGSRIVGKLGSRGNFIPDEEKFLELIVPDLEGFKLKPYVANGVNGLGFIPKNREV